MKKKFRVARKDPTMEEMRLAFTGEEAEEKLKTMSGLEFLEKCRETFSEYITEEDTVLKDRSVRIREKNAPTNEQSFSDEITSFMDTIERYVTNNPKCTAYDLLGK